MRIEPNRSVFCVKGPSDGVVWSDIYTDPAGVLREKPAGHCGQKQSGDALMTPRRQDVDPFQFGVASVPSCEMTGHEADDLAVMCGHERGAVGERLARGVLAAEVRRKAGNPVGLGFPFERAQFRE